MWRDDNAIPPRKRSVYSDRYEEEIPHKATSQICFNSCQQKTVFQPQGQREKKCLQPLTPENFASKGCTVTKSSPRSKLSSGTETKRRSTSVHRIHLKWSLIASANLSVSSMRFLSSGGGCEETFAMTSSLALSTNMFCP